MASWSANIDNIPMLWRDWLTDPSSLTKKLSHHCQQFNVDLIGQYWQQAEKNENHFDGQPTWVREVYLQCDHAPVIFARSFFPKSLIDAKITDIENLGNTPLGHILFDQCNAKPSEFEFSLICHNGENQWSRRRYFTIDQYQCLVTEIFLPEILNLEKN